MGAERPSIPPPYPPPRRGEECRAQPIPTLGGHTPPPWITWAISAGVGIEGWAP